MSTLRSIWWQMLLLAILAVAFYFWIIIPRGILERGATAPAEVLEVWATSTMINDEPLAGLLLEVRPPGKAPYQVKKYCRATFNNEWLLEPGTQLEVRYDPDSPQRVMIASAACDAELNSIGLIGLSVPGFILITAMVAPLLGHLALWRESVKQNLPAMLPVEPPASLPGNPPPKPEEEEGEPAARLKKLEELHRLGLITSDEYERARSRIIDSL